ncbi:putative cytochrome P450, partial [Pseudolycoriella hygida]
FIKKLEKHHRVELNWFWLKMLILFSILCIIGFFCGKIYLRQRRLLKYVRHLPTENGLPLVGIGHRFIGQSTTGIYNQLIRISESFENPSRYWFGPTLIIVVSSPNDMQTVLNSPHCLQKPYLYSFFDVENNGLFMAKAHIWKPTRKLLNPTFNNKILSSFIPVFNEKTKIMADNLMPLSHGAEPFDISKQFFACTLDMVCATTLGAHYEFQTGKNTDVLECMEKYSEVIAERMVKLWLHWDVIFKWSNLCKVQMKLFEIIDTLPKEIHQLKKKQFKKSQSNAVEKSNESEEFKEPQIFVDELLRLESAGLIDDRMVADQIQTIIVGGNETTALTSSHVILMLAMHQDVQERAFQEIKSAHASQYSDTDAEVMTKLNYLEMVIRETMRILPVGPFLGREALEDVKISKCTIPKGALILLAFHVLHRDKSVWGPNPEKFNPEHFLPQKVAQRHPYSFLPFSAGPRNCIGIKYGWMSMKVMLSALLRRYKFTTDLKLEDLVGKWDITLKIVNRHFVRIEPRVY